MLLPSHLTPRVRLLFYRFLLSLSDRRKTVFNSGLSQGRGCIHSFIQRGKLHFKQRVLVSPPNHDCVRQNCTQINRKVSISETSAGKQGMSRKCKTYLMHDVIMIMLCKNTTIFPHYSMLSVYQQM